MNPVKDKWFRNQVRDLLVVLPQTCPGMGLVVHENATTHTVMLYPRAGSPIKDEQDLLALTWFEVKLQKPLNFQKVDTKETVKMLKEVVNSQSIEEVGS